MPSSSATDDTAQSPVPEPDSALGRAFVEALSAKDFERLEALFDREIDFRGLTPDRAWEATDSNRVVEGILRQWFEDSDEIEQVLAVETDSFADRERVGYRFRIRNPDGQFVAEQQAYYTARDGRITWMRVLCSGFRPLSST
jgi:ketosteroid isomerase-like protein